MPQDDNRRVRWVWLLDNTRFKKALKGGLGLAKKVSKGISSAFKKAAASMGTQII